MQRVYQICWSPFMDCYDIHPGSEILLRRFDGCWKISYFSLCSLMSCFLITCHAYWQTVVCWHREIIMENSLMPLGIQYPYPSNDPIHKQLILADISEKSKCKRYIPQVTFSSKWLKLVYLVTILYYERGLAGK